MAYFGDTRQGRRRDDILAALVVIAAITLLFLPDAVQDPMRQGIRRTALGPFVTAQSALAEQRAQREDVGSLRSQRDSLLALSAALAPVLEENRRLRGLLDLRERTGVPFMATEVVRVGVQMGESTFLLPIGEDVNVRPGAPVLADGGLLGVVREVDPGSAQAIDWTHPEFRASAMTSDGTVYGIVEPRRGRYREEDQLALTGAPFHSDLRPGARVVTSGRGGIYPRGIPLGTVVGIDEADTGWRKSYILRPAVRPEGATHVLVGIGEAPTGGDLSRAWFAPVTRDTAGIAADTTSRGGV